MTINLEWLLYLQFIFKPYYWVMNYPYLKEVDSIILELLENNDFESYTDKTHKLGDAIIWTGNHPYASFTLYGTCLEKYRPSRLTIWKARIKLKKLEITKLPSNECVKSVRQKYNLK